MPDPAPPIAGLLETSLYADDVRRTADFYRGLFEFKALVDSPRLVAFEVAKKHVLLVFQRGATDDDVVDARGTIPGHDGSGRLHLALSIAASDLEAWRGRLANRGVAIEGEYGWPRGGKSLYFRDPDGALVELATPGLWWTPVRAGTAVDNAARGA
ncbi:VOC family protein [Roseiarcus sp.]|uniref:VOC family protein n=1 Tax=Roseiarcus sp. TaxID=1969460 RepID=UPI003F95695E